MSPLAFPDPPLTAGGIVLRPWREDDLEPAFAATQDPLIPQFTHVPPGQTLAQLRVFVHGLDTARAAGEELAFVVADADSDELLGTASLLRIGWDAGRAEIGYWLAPWARGRGAATLATQLISQWALQALPLRRIELRIDARNDGSLAVAERAGFVREGTLRAYEEVNGTVRDMVSWSLLASDL